MKFTCNTQELLSALHLVSRAIGTQQALPILGNVLVQAEDGKLTLSATDLELSILVEVQATVSDNGSITVPSKAFVNFVQYNNDSEVTLELIDNAKVKCSSAHAKAMIAGENASDYPTITTVDGQSTFTLESESFLRALHLVTFAAAKTTLRPVLSGVFMKGENGSLTFVATDSYRLSEYSLPVEGVSQMQCIIPSKILDEMHAVLAGKKGDKKPSEKTPDDSGATRVQVILGRQQVEMRAGPVRLISRLIEGKFPDYHQIVPKDTKTKVLFPVQDFQTAVKRLHYFAKEVNNNVTFQCGESETKLSTLQTQLGKDEATVSAELTGEENKIALSSSFLLDFLGRINSDVVEMRMTDSLHPAVFKLTDEESYLHLIMPLRMQEE